MMTGGIDSILNNRMAAGRQDPQYLMNSYQQNQDLIDLLALQKLKSEKEAAARQMMLQGGGTPPTVREQREQELVQMNKNELAQQVGGVAQQQMGQQQQAMQKLLQGIGGQNTPSFADGGIVGYQEGGDVEDEIVGYDGAGNPIYASDMARLENAGAVDETEEGAARRAAYEALRLRGERSLQDLVSAARNKSIQVAPEPEGRSGVLRGAKEFLDGAGISGLMRDVVRGGSNFLGLYTPEFNAQIRGEGEPMTARRAGEMTREVGTAVPRAVGDVVSPVARGAGDFYEGFMGINGDEAPAAAAQTAIQTSQPTGRPVKTMTPAPAQAPTMGAPLRETNAPSPADYLRSVATPRGEFDTQQASAQPTAQQGGIGSLAQQMQDLQKRRDSKWGTFADWALGVGSAPRTELGQALGGGARALNEREDRFNAQLMEMLKTQQAMDLGERGMQVDEGTLDYRREALELEQQLAEKNWEREDIRYAQQREQALIEAAIEAGGNAREVIDVFKAIMAAAPIGADPATIADSAFEQALRLVGSTGGGLFQIEEVLD